MLGCKVEDTLKKPKEILCAAYNIKIPEEAEHLSPDDPVSNDISTIKRSSSSLKALQVFEEPVKRLVGVERLMLEAVGFNFRTLHPHQTVFRMLKELQLDYSEEMLASATALKVVKDIFRTFAGNKQTHTTIAIATLELSLRVHGLELDRFNDYVYGGEAADTKWATSRAEIMGKHLSRMTVCQCYH